MVLPINDAANDIRGHYPEIAQRLDEIAKEAQVAGMPNTVEEFPPLEFSFEKEVERIKSEHDAQLQWLYELGLIERTGKGGEYYVIGEKGERKLAPTSEQIATRITKQREELEPKMHQGFLQYQITPIIKKDRLISALARELVSRYSNSSLFRAGTLNAATLNTDMPVWKSDIHNEKSRYYVGQLGLGDKKGLTEVQLFDMTGGLLSTLEEVRPDLHNIETITAREQLGNNESVNTVLEKLGNGRYKSELGMITQQWLVMALRSLRKTGEVLDDFWGNGMSAILAGESWRWRGQEIYSLAHFNFGQKKVNLLHLFGDTKSSEYAPRVSVMIK